MIQKESTNRAYWYNLYHHVRDLKEYKTLDDEWDILYSKNPKQDMTPETIDELESILIRYWKHINSNFCIDLTKKIDKWKIKGILFQDLIDQINNIQSKAEKEDIIEEQIGFFKELKNTDDYIKERILREKIKKKERILREKIKKKEHNRERIIDISISGIISFILGIFSGLILSSKCV